MVMVMVMTMREMLVGLQVCDASVVVGGGDDDVMLLLLLAVVMMKKTMTTMIMRCCWLQQMTCVPQPLLMLEMTTFTPVSNGPKATNPIAITHPECHSYTYTSTHRG